MKDRTYYLENPPETHRYGRLLVQGWNAQGSLVVVPCETPEAAQRLRRKLCKVRANKHWAKPGTFDETPWDPKGTGQGQFRNVRIRVAGHNVLLIRDDPFTQGLSHYHAEIQRFRAYRATPSETTQSQPQAPSPVARPVGWLTKIFGGA